ncbi:MAG: cation transporter [Lachnospiraceae bacterium]|nr:cation transporter [Lachnospiraceae bacterium]
MTQNKSGSRTMLMSVVMSAPGPIVVGIGLFLGKSSTQLADFIRRSAELMAIIVAFITYQLTSKPTVDTSQKRLLERRSNLFVGIAMCVSGISMLLISLFSKNTEQGNVIPGLCIAILGVIANTIFWFRYKKLGTVQNNTILLVQSRLYRAKSLVDICVTAALLVVMFMPGSAIAFYFDRIGSGIVSVYLIWCGGKTISEC